MTSYNHISSIMESNGLRRGLFSALLSLPLLAVLTGQELRGEINYTDGLSLEKSVYTPPVGPVLNPITDLVQMRNAERAVAEFGNHKGNGGVRVLVKVGDGLNPQGYDRTIHYTVDGSAIRGDGKDYTIDGCTSSNCSVRLPANRHSVPITIYVNNDGLDENDETIILTLQDGSGYTVNKSRIAPDNPLHTYDVATLTIRDDDTRGLDFRRSWADVKEGGSQTYTVKLRSQPTAAVTVNIVSNNQDVTVSPTSLTFNPSGSNLWSRTQTVAVAAAQDSDAVDDEATLTHTTSGGDYGGDNALSIDRPVSVDDDTGTTPPTPDTPVITVTAGADVTEGSPASFTVNADPAPTARLTVNLEVEEPPHSDVVAENQEGVRTVTLNAGATSTTFTVPTVNDNTDESDGAVYVFVNYGGGYVAGSGTSVIVRDNDDPIPAAFFRSASSDAVEHGGTHNVTVNLNYPAPAGGLTLRYRVSGTATAGGGNDFTIQNSGTLSIAAGDTSATVPVAINDDSSKENAETVILTLTGGTGYTVDSPSVHTLTIADNDSTSAAFAASSSSADEDDGTHNVTVNLSQAAPVGGLTLSYRVTGTATAGSGNDFTILNSGSLAIAAGATSADIVVAINDDSTEESDETVILTLTGGTGYKLGSATTHTLTITASDQLPISAILAPIGGTPLPEGAGFIFNTGFSRLLRVNEMVTLPLTIGGTATLGTDYRLTCGSVPGAVIVTCSDLDGDNPTITFDGSMLRSPVRRFMGPLHLEALEDNTTESNETVKLALGGSARTITITDTPSSVALSFTRNTFNVNEDDSPFQPVIRFTPASGRDLTIPLIFTNVTATSGADYTAPAQVVFEANGNTRHSFDIPILDDTVHEGDETFTVAIDTANLPAGFTAGAITEVTVTITDNEPPITAILGTSNADSTLPEGVADSFNIVLDRPLGSNETATLPLTIGGTATLGTDYRLTCGSGSFGVVITCSGLNGNSPSITFDGALLQGRRRFTGPLHLETLEDNTTESNETVTLALGGGPTLTLTITEAPSSVALSFTRSTYSVNEAEDEVLPTIIVTPTSGRDLTVPLIFTDGTAKDGEDFTALAQVVLDANGRSRNSLAIPILDDTVHEGDETFTMAIDTANLPTGVTAGSISAVTITIVDDDEAGPTASFAAGASSAAENAGTHNVRVNLSSAAPSGGLTLGYSVSGTATAGSGNDFTIQNSGMLSVAAGATTANIPVVINDDSTEESAETVILTLTSGTGYNPGSPSVHTLTITDNDNDRAVLSSISIAGGSTITEGETATFTLTANPAPASAITVRVQVKNINIRFRPGDSNSRTVTIGTSGKVTLSVITRDDNNDWPNGTLYATVQEGTGYTVAAEPNNGASVGVQDNDYPANYPVLSVSDASAKESERDPNCAAGLLPCMTFTVTLNRALEEGERVHFAYRTRESTPRSAEGTGFQKDYHHKEGTARFTPGDGRTKSFQVTLVDDNINDGGETFEFVISSASGARITDGLGVGTITNDDPLPTAFLGRFGRGLAEQAVSGITGRLTAGRTPGFQGQFLGRAPAGGENRELESAERALALSQDRAPAFAGNGLGTGTGGSGLSDVSMDSSGMPSAGRTLLSGNDALSSAETTPGYTPTLAEALAGSAFTYTREADEAGGSFGLWGRGMHATFNGSEGTLNVDGTLTTGLIGADYARADWQAGLAVLLTGGKGRFKGETGHGKLDTSMTAFVPYAAKQAGRLSLWGAAGVGLGEMILSETLTETHSTASLNTDMGWQMAAGGVRSDVGIFFGETGPELALVGDAQWTRTTSEQTRGLSASKAQTTRLRVGVEGGWSLAFAEQSLRPTLEAGVRYDAGDAETGLGVDVGAALSWAHTRWGLAVDIEGRTLVLHEAKRFTHSGFSAALTFDPDLTSLLGPSLTLTHRLGGPSNGGMDALFAETLPGSGGNGIGGGQWQAEAAYGMALFRGRFIGAPTLGYALSGQSNDYRLGWRLTPAGVNSLPVSAEVGAMRREMVGAEADHGVTVNLRSQW